MGERAWLQEHDGLQLKAASRLAHPCDLAFWQDRGWITDDLNAGCIRLTAAGRDRIAMTCGNCRAWHHIGENRGQCRSAERCDDGQAHAGITREYETCEAWIARPTPSPSGKEGGDV